MIAEPQQYPNNPAKLLAGKNDGELLNLVLYILDSGEISKESYAELMTIQDELLKREHSKISV